MIDGETKDEPRDVSALLQRLEDGDAGARDELYPIVYDELRRIAVRQMSQQGRDHTIGSTGLVHEVFLRLVKNDASPWRGRTHFLAVASTVMRRVLVDYAREREAAKRTPDETAKPASASVVEGFEERAIDLLALNEAMDRLAALDPKLSRLVELRFFGGQPFEQCAEILSVSTKTAKRWWSTARSWLRREMDR